MMWHLLEQEAGERGSRGEVSCSQFFSSAPLPLCPSAPLPLVLNAQLTYLLSSGKSNVTK